MKAFHFTDGMTLRDGQTLEVGKTYIYDGEIKICRSGYHASKNVLDALKYAPGFTLSLVECDEIEEEHDDKFVYRIRKVLEIHDVREIVLNWCIDVAEEAVKKYWTDEKDSRPFDAIEAARECLENPSDKNIAAAAARAAYDAARDAAAWAARADAARAAAYAAWAAYDAARDAADAARDAADAAYAAADAYAAQEVELNARLQIIFNNSLDF